MSVKLRGIQTISIVIALVCSLLSFTSAPAQAVVPPTPTCAEGGPCVVGDTGPGGGKIFYVAATTFTQADATGSMCINNCLYLEVAPSGWLGSSEPLFAWSYRSGDETGIANDATAYNNALGIGLGYKNSRIIATELNPNNAAKMAVDYNGGSKNDWYLPTIAELNLLCQWARGVASSVTTGCSGGSLNSATYRADTSGFVSGNYWSSSERDASNGWMQTFSSGVQGTAAKTFNTYVRPIRAFAPTVDSLAITRASVGTQRGTAFTTQPQITVKNPVGETVTASSAIVTATISSGGTLIGTTTATASSGVATFSNLGINGTVGSTYTITYSATGLVPISAAVTLSGTTCNGATFTCQVGDTGPGGGKIFYVAPTTFTQPGATISMCSTWCKYLEAAPSTWFSSSGDPTRRWVGPNYEDGRIFYDWLNTFLGTDGVSIGSGYQNSEYLRGTDSSTTDNSAAALARAYSGGGKTDWYLPARNELDPLYAQRAIVGGISDARNYWSSTEFNETRAWYLYTAYSNQQSVSETALKVDETLYVRPIRAFGIAPTTISIPNVVIPAPVRGETPVSSITSNGQFTTAITWSGSPSIFDSSTAYTATATVTPVAGYTLAGIATNFFTVNGSAPTSVVSPITASILGTTGLIPTGIAVDSSGNVYTANFWADNVTKITPQGVTTTLGTTGSRPTGIVIDASGNIYTSNLNSNNVTKITSSGVSTTFGNTGLGPSGIAIDAAGNVYTANFSGNSVTKITPSGAATNIPCTPCEKPMNIAVDHLGNIFTTNSADILANQNVTKITPSGVSTIFGTVGRNPWGIAVDALGNVYVSNVGDDTVTKILPNGDSAVFGSTGGMPWGVAVDAVGNVYTANASFGSTNAAVTKISPQGVASTLLRYPAFSALPEIAVDAAGNVYFADSGNRVIKLAPTNSGVFTYRFPATAAPTADPVVDYVAPTPVPYLKTLTTPKLRLSAGKLLCTPGTYNAGYTLDGVIQGSTTTLFTPSSFTYNLLINGITQTSLAVTSSSTSHSWTMPTTTSGALITCSVTVTANGITNTDESGGNTSGASSALTTQSAAIATANVTYSAALSANTKAYQKALVDNRTQWRSTTEKIRTDYYAERNRINSLPSTEATRALSSAALKAYTAALKKSAADYKASGPAALAAKDVADKAALDAKTTAIAKANAAYGTAIESIGYGVLVP